ncbi:MAG: hypothetical protein ABW292_24945, partial [Vicinamibacterales bacterium]
MMRFFVLVALAAQAPPSPPDLEIVLATLSVKGRTVEIGAPVNISNSPGYDNQPTFTPDGGAVLFTSVRGDRKPDPANAAATGSEIYRYEIGAARLSQVTETPESEYSPRVTPDGTHISVIRVEADGTQRLWRFAMDGTKVELVLRDIKPVGYYAWASDKTLALFVLGKQGQPATLQVADVGTGEAKVVATSIGRSIQRIPGGGISFVSKRRAGNGQKSTFTINELNPETRQVSSLIDVSADASDVDTAWHQMGCCSSQLRGNCSVGGKVTPRSRQLRISRHWPPRRNEIGRQPQGRSACARGNKAVTTAAQSPAPV